MEIARVKESRISPQNMSREFQRKMQTRKRCLAENTLQPEKHCKRKRSKTIHEYVPLQNYLQNVTNKSDFVSTGVDHFIKKPCICEGEGCDISLGHFQSIRFRFFYFSALQTEGWPFGLNLLFSEFGFTPRPVSIIRYNVKTIHDFQK